MKTVLFTIEAVFDTASIDFFDNIVRNGLGTAVTKLQYYDVSVGPYNTSCVYFTRTPDTARHAEQYVDLCVEALRQAYAINGFGMFILK
jgi:hypothetical protein